MADKEPESKTGKTGAFYPVKKIFVFDPGDISVGIRETIITIESASIIDPMVFAEPDEYVEECRRLLSECFSEILDCKATVIFEGEEW